METIIVIQVRDDDDTAYLGSSGDGFEMSVVIDIGTSLGIDVRVGTDININVESI